MVRQLNLAANPLRLLLALALLLLGALLVGFSINQPPIRTTGSHSQPASVFVTAPNPASQPAASTVASQSTSATTRIVTGSSQGPAVSAPLAAAEPVQVPSSGMVCQANPPVGRGTPVICSNP